MKLESLILDIDGTLWDSRALVAEGYYIQLKREGLEHLASQFLQSQHNGPNSDQIAVGDSLFLFRSPIVIPVCCWGT